MTRCLLLTLPPLALLAGCASPHPARDAGDPFYLASPSSTAARGIHTNDVDSGDQHGLHVSPHSPLSGRDGRGDPGNGLAPGDPSSGALSFGSGTSP